MATATAPESSKRPSLWDIAASSTALLTQELEKNVSKRESCSSSQESSLNILSGILGAINTASLEDNDNNNQQARTMEVNNKESPPPMSSVSSGSSSFLSRWSSVGSSPEEPEEGAKDTKWRTSSIRDSGIQATPDRPSVYEESLEMIMAALLIYTFADLRKLARKGKIPSNELTKYPISISQVMEAIETHKEVLDAEAKIDQDDLRFRLKALEQIHDQQVSSSSLLGRILRGGSSKKKGAALTHFHDEKSTQGMVYGIAVNHIRKRITVIFRGSVTQQDFVTDVKLAQKKVNNPVAKVVSAMESPTTINIHTGFYQYLFKKDESGRVRIEHILEDVKALMKKYKGYRMFCTGHSLGGALSSLCGFYASTDPEITKNGSVVVVSVASPRVGNDDFRTAFQNLERLQLLQHLRISNKEDVVTLLPFVAWKEASLSPSILAPTSHSVNLYKHCGIHLKFKSGNPENCKDERLLLSVTYAKDKADDEGTLPEDLKRSVVAAKSLFGSLFATRADFKRVSNFHCCDEYERRLEKSKQYLDSITLDQLYADKNLVGSAVAAPVLEMKSTKKKSRGSFFGKRKSSTSVKA